MESIEVDVNILNICIIACQKFNELDHSMINMFDTLKLDSENKADFNISVVYNAILIENQFKKYTVHLLMRNTRDENGIKTKKIPTRILGSFPIVGTGKTFNGISVIDIEGLKFPNKGIYELRGYLQEEENVDNISEESKAFDKEEVINAIKKSKLASLIKIKLI